MHIPIYYCSVFPRLRALHEKEDKSKGMTRMKFFLIFMGASFIYYAFPGYLLQILSFFSWVCWVWPHSITAQQIGSSKGGLGLGAFSFDWAGISAYHGSPLVSPWFSILNVGVGFVMFIYIIVPVCYWKFNTFDARKFPIFSNQLFTRTGQKYDTKKVLTPDFELNVAAYNSYGKLYLSPLFALSIGSGFARFTATLTHVALFHGRYALSFLALSIFYCFLRQVTEFSLVHELIPMVAVFFFLSLNLLFHEFALPYCVCLVHILLYSFTFYV